MTTFTFMMPQMAFDSEFASRATKCMIAARYAGVKLEAPKDFEFGKTNETEAYAKNCQPMMRVPSLQTPEGYIFESNAIARHIARQDKTNQGLLGKTVSESSQVDMWVDFTSGELDTHIGTLAMPVFYGAPSNPEKETAAREALMTATKALDTWLEVRTFFVGERLTLADIVVACSIHALFKGLGEKKMEHTNLVRWYKTVIAQPHFAAHIKECRDKVPKKEEKKVEKKAEKKPEVEEEEAPMPAKKPNPLDLLPPSKFVLDAFKREYSNKDTRTVAAPFFFDNYDAEGFSCFWCKYKYNNELGMQFMSANLIRGWFQRMDRLHKYAFGSVLIIGEDNKHEISGLFVFRGKGLPEILLEVDDVEHYTWTEVDVAKEREAMTDYMCWEGPTINGPVLEGRVFK